MKSEPTGELVAPLISDELKVELKRRLAEFEADPAAGSPWEEVRRRILQGTWRSI
ncbi:MAG TPA: addiction module protein [Thermoanaerobaculia bacterium]|nr:addiction module protein [Thermoanaerobaculia bacterium]